MVSCIKLLARKIKTRNKALWETNKITKNSIKSSMKNDDLST